MSSVTPLSRIKTITRINTAITTIVCSVMDSGFTKEQILSIADDDDMRKELEGIVDTIKKARKDG